MKSFKKFITEISKADLTKHYDDMEAAKGLVGKPSSEEDTPPEFKNTDSAKPVELQRSRMLEITQAWLQDPGPIMAEYKRKYKMTPSETLALKGIVQKCDHTGPDAISPEKAVAMYIKSPGPDSIAIAKAMVDKSIRGSGREVNGGFRAAFPEYFKDAPAPVEKKPLTDGQILATCNKIAKKAGSELVFDRIDWRTSGKGRFVGNALLAGQKGAVGMLFRIQNTGGAYDPNGRTIQFMGKRMKAV
jgi:hypothetical protein